MESSTTKHYRHITLSKGLSKYGPWGYLILGMLLCGGALLVCVLWGNNFNQQFHFLISVKHKTLTSLILTLQSIIFKITIFINLRLISTSKKMKN